MIAHPGIDRTEMIFRRSRIFSFGIELAHAEGAKAISSSVAYVTARKQLGAGSLWICFWLSGG